MLCRTIRWRLLALLVLPALALLQAGCAHRDAPAALPGPAQQIAPGVYLLRGMVGLVEPANRGRVGNAGFIVGPDGVVVIDTGTSYRHGQALLARIAEVTPLPVKLAIVTHTRQEFLFGAQAFRERGIPVAMHAMAARLMAARCEGCLKTLRQQLGEAEMAGTTMFKPDLVFDADFSVAGLGRPVRVLHFGPSSGPGDVAVLDDTTGALFAGGLVDDQRVPDIQDARLPEWEHALAQLQSMPIRHIIPGHGPAGGPALAGGVLRYLRQLQQSVRELVDKGVSLGDAVERAESEPPYRNWAGYEIIHRRNVSIAYLRQEQALMFKP